MAYLLENKPRQTQYRARRGEVTGLIVIHTAESQPDTTGPDDGTMNVARFIQGRSDYGSYHALCDSDSRLLLVPYYLAAYGDATGSNEFGIHISAATQAHRWPTLSKEWKDGCIKQMAAQAADAARWLKRKHGISVPARLLTKRESDQGKPGFISHGLRDPARRTDPGKDFPWGQFFREFEALMNPPASKPKMSKRRRVGIANVPRKVGREGWRKAWWTMVKECDAWGINENSSPRQRRLYYRLTEGNPNIAQFGARITPNPIFWRGDLYKAVERRVIKIHGSAGGTEAKRWPGYNSARSITLVVLQDRFDEQDPFVVACSHFAPGGKKVRRLWRAWAISQSKKAVRRVIKDYTSQGMDVVFIADTNLHRSFRLTWNFSWIKGWGIDKIGVGAAKGRKKVKGKWKLVNIPTDHKGAVVSYTPARG